MLELVTSSSEPESSQGLFDKLTRWEDDGGSVFETDPLLPQAAEINTPRPMDAAGECFLYDE